MIQSTHELQSALESILFAAGREVRISELATAVGASESDILAALQQMSVFYERDYTRGLVLLAHEGSVELVTSAKNAAAVRHFFGKETATVAQEDLSDASMETLAVIAYRGPLSKAAIDQLRGINSAVMIRNLLVRGFIEKVRDRAGATNGGAELYQVTSDFLRATGKERVEDFPEYEALHASVTTAPQ